MSKSYFWLGFILLLIIIFTGSVYSGYKLKESGLDNVERAYFVKQTCWYNNKTHVSINQVIYIKGYDVSCKYEGVGYDEFLEWRGEE